MVIQIILLNLQRKEVGKGILCLFRLFMCVIKYFKSIQ